MEDPVDGENKGKDLRLVPGSHGQNVPSTCTIVIIAGINDTKQTNFSSHSIQVGTLIDWTG